MNSRTILNLSLLALLLGLGSVIFFEPGLEPEPELVALSTLGVEEVTHIRIENEGSEPITFEKRDDHWVVLHKQAIAASTFQIRSLLELLKAKATRSYPSSEMDLSRLTLDPATSSVTFNENIRFEFGATESLQRQRYVRSGTRVHLIEDRYQHLIETEFTTYVSHQLFPDNTEIVAIRLPEFSLQLDDDTHWTLAPDDLTISADAIQEFIDTWQRASALWVREYEPSASEQVVEINTADSEQPSLFVIVSSDPELVLARPDLGIQYHLPEDLGKDMLGMPKPEQARESDESMEQG